ncbi:hypothetical protein [Geitlerinema sp. PCC 9228]|jgi:Na+/proline symporter|uniref:hypothetical protein n=1 Tax=Geitlerinema sp. PCC 9228 TaxID=111611 RepID=UPI0008F9B74D|nr:hypothetical protein [Geitlerinema sp. PCC 9228]
MVSKRRRKPVKYRQGRDIAIGFCFVVAINTLVVWLAWVLPAFLAFFLRRLAFFIGYAQLFYLIPVVWRLRANQEYGKIRGAIAGAIVTAIVNAGFWIWLIRLVSSF